MTDFVVKMQGGDFLSNQFLDKNLKEKNEYKIKYSSIALSSFFDKDSIEKNTGNIILSIRSHKYLGYTASEINGIVDRLVRNDLFFMSEVSLDDLQVREFKTDDGFVKKVKFFEDDSKTKNILSKLLNFNFLLEENVDKTFIHMHPVGCDHFIAMRLIKKENNVYIFYINSHVDLIAKQNGDKIGTDLNELSLDKSFKSIKNYLDSLDSNFNIYVVNIDSNVKQFGNWACSLFALNNCDLLKKIPEDKLIKYALLNKDVKKNDNEKNWIVFEKEKDDDIYVELTTCELDKFNSLILFEKNNIEKYKTKEELLFGILEKINIKNDKINFINKYKLSEEIQFSQKIKNVEYLFFEILYDIIGKDKTIDLINDYRNYGVYFLKEKIKTENFSSLIKNSKFLKNMDNLILTIKFLKQLSFRNQIADITLTNSSYIVSYFQKNIFQEEILPILIKILEKYSLKKNNLFNFSYMIKNILKPTAISFFIKSFYKTD